MLVTAVPYVMANSSIDAPKHIHLTSQGDPATTVTVTWKTTTSITGDIVLYDTVSRGSNPSMYSYSETGYNHLNFGASGYIHDVKLAGLKPNTTYYFVCGGPDNYSEERSFKTAPRLASDFQFVIGGDSRTNIEDRTKVSTAVKYTSASFVLHSGDMVEHGWTQSQWDLWFTDVDDNWINNEGHTLPIIPCLGNHEKNATNYYEQFALPGNEQWYYYDWGPSLRIIVLNSEASSSQISVDQVNWLRQILYSTPDNKWKIVMFHRNLYYSGAHTNASDLMQHWVPLLDKYHVDIVIQGHTHHYHRSKPMYNHACVASYDEGTMYLTSGGWGAPMIDYVEQPYSAYGSKTLHFILVSIYQNGTLCLEAMDVNGHIFDTMRLYKATNANETQYRPPEALAGEDQTVAEDTFVTLSGINSLNSTNITSYTWSFVDETLTTLSGAIQHYNFTNPGAYLITLNVTDTIGNFSTDSLHLTVYDTTSPIANAGGDKTINVNTPIIFDANESSDNVGIVSYDWNFGDETSETGVTATHIYTKTGKYIATLTVQDAAGNSDTTAITITVQAEFPTWIIVMFGVIAVGIVVVIYLRKT